MSRKNLIKHFKMFDATDLSTDSTSEKTNVDPVDQGTIALDWTGTAPVGAFTVEASNSSDVEFSQGNEVWIELDFGTVILITGNTGNHQIIFDSMPFRFIRVLYVKTSGIGELTAQFHSKSLGA